MSGCSTWPPSPWRPSRWASPRAASTSPWPTSAAVPGGGPARRRRDVPAGGLRARHRLRRGRPGGARGRGGGRRGGAGAHPLLAGGHHRRQQGCRGGGRRATAPSAAGPPPPGRGVGAVVRRSGGARAAARSVWGACRRATGETDGPASQPSGDFADRRPSARTPKGVRSRRTRSARSDRCAVVGEGAGPLPGVLGGQHRLQFGGGDGPAVVVSGSAPVADPQRRRACWPARPPAR